MLIRCRMSPDKLAYMANQIGRFFATQKREEAVTGIENHIRKFWDPRMRRTLLEHLDQVELAAPVREALKKLEAG